MERIHSSHQVLGRYRSGHCSRGWRYNDEKDQVLVLKNLKLQEGIGRISGPRRCDRKKAEGWGGVLLLF